MWTDSQTPTLKPQCETLTTTSHFQRKNEQMPPVTPVDDELVNRWRLYVSTHNIDANIHANTSTPPSMMQSVIGKTSATTSNEVTVTMWRNDTVEIVVHLKLI